MYYQVLSEFIEDNHHYKKGDGYPFSDEVDQERVKYLSDYELNGKVTFIKNLESEEQDNERENETSDPFKGVRSDSMKKVLSEKKIEFDETIERADLIKLMIENNLTV
ncbi:hypothetical protein [Enterococcus sp. DIV1420a]|uniref:hypothetical protein n=1 Tax=Enterococcus sp. DIV1420a TaxID=2774672 RepID=UPI003F25C51A